MSDVQIRNNQPTAMITGLNGEALVGDIMLIKKGKYTVVKVNLQGKWYEAIREISEDNFSHNITAVGLLALTKDEEKNRVK